ncbi:replication initiator [Solirubrobacter ginsenosidimutans]
MATNEPQRVRPHVGAALRGRVARLVDAPERHHTALAVELDSGVCIHLADVASIGRDTRRARRREPRLAECAHALGYRGHCLTKSRRYSSTFKALRAAREAYVHAQLLARSTDATQLAIAAGGTRKSNFACVGTDHVTAADALLAASAAARAREGRRAARLARDVEFGTGGMR